MNVEGVSDTVSGFLADLILGLGGGGVPEYVSQHFLTFILFLLFLTQRKSLNEVHNGGQNLLPQAWDFKKITKLI